MKMTRLCCTLLAALFITTMLSACSFAAMPAKQNDAMMEKSSPARNTSTDKMTQTQEMATKDVMTETMAPSMTESMTDTSTMSDTMMTDTMITDTMMTDTMMTDTMKSDTMSKAEPKFLLQGSFQASGSDTPGAGDVMVIEENGQHILKLSNFTTTPGPDLHVFLIENAQAHNANEFGNAIDLGALQSPNGDQQYTLPADADLSEIHAAVVHCVTYNHLFLTAGF